MIAFQIAAPGEISLARIYGLKLEPLSSGLNWWHIHCLPIGTTVKSISRHFSILNKVWLSATDE